MVAIDFAASEAHWVQHLGPVAIRALAQGHDVRFFTKAGLEDYVPRPVPPVITNPGPTTPDTPITVCSSWADARNAKLRDRRVVLMEHGAGQSYSDRNPSYVGGKGRNGLAGVLLPNQQAAERHQRFYPDGPPCRVIGSPWVDFLIRQYGAPVTAKPPVLTVSWHWPCKALPETESAFELMGLGILSELLDLDRRGVIQLRGHCHPRAHHPRETYERLAIPFIETFEEVCSVSAIYMVDNSSTLFEFAALDRPVIVVNSPRYRRMMRHGLRFWEYSSIGPNVWQAHEVYECVKEAIIDESADRRRSMVAEIYPHQGMAAQRAVDAIVEWSER